MELVANVYAVTGMERHTIWLLFCVSGVCQEWLVLKCVQDLDGDSSLHLPLFSAPEGPRPCLGIEGGDGTDGQDAESRLKVDCLKGPRGPSLFFKGPFFLKYRNLTYSK